jgi:hypothetical protein
MAPPGKVEITAPETERMLNVALVYQDTLSLKWATQVCDQLAQRVGKESVRRTWWEISRLSDPGMLEDAVLSAMQADVIIVSVYDAEELPFALCVWISIWLSRRTPSAGALVALISLPEQPDSQTFRAQNYLRAVARTARMDFLLRERMRTVTSHGFVYVEKNADKTNATTQLLQEVLSQNHNTDWGIDEPRGATKAA